MKKTQIQIDVTNSLNHTIVPGVTGATMGAGSDCYPYTIHAFEVSKTGRVTLFVTADSYEWIPDAGFEGKGSENGRGHFKFTSTPPAPGSRGGAVKMWTKEGKHWHIGSRRYYQDPHF